jgi:nucleoside-diphosphate-sugar epimerase
MKTRKRILITGAAGCIGRDIAQRLSGRYNLVLSDIKRPNNLLGCLYFEIDITDLDAMRSACRDIDTVLHLAADPSIEATWESLLTNNIIGAYNVFQAAHEAGCRRVVFASSAFAVLGYPPEIEVHTGMPVRPSNLYGASKAWGEAVGRFYADQKELSCICLRIGFVKRHDNAGILPDAPMLDMFVTYRDLAKLIVASIEAPDGLRFGIFHGLSDNRHKRLDISNARSELGYEPEDDAYELADMNARLF